MKYIDKVRCLFVGIFTAINSFLGTLAMPFYILVCTNIMDYLTGIAASRYRGEAVNSHRGFHGIAKKICMWLLVAIGYILDYCIMSLGNTIGMTNEFKCLVSVAVVFWLLFNELISILENINDIGTPLPPFLLKLTKLLKAKTENNFEENSTKDSSSF